MKQFWTFLATVSLILIAVACSETASDDHSGDLTLPALTALELDGRKLNVVATTNIIGDVVTNIGGDAIELTVLLGPNQDPHSYEATPGDLIALEEADIIFSNGWDLEERLAEQIEDTFGDKSVLISAEIEPRDFDETHDDHSHENADPHVWFDIDNVAQWAINTESVLSQLNPDNAAIYASNLADYSAELDTLATDVDQMLSAIPANQRKLVTNHDSLGYFAGAYNFELVGTVIPGFSTSAEPSASELAALIDAMTQAGVCTVFVETTASDALAATVSAELDQCDAVQVLPLYTGSLGSGDASSYIGMFRANVETIVEGLKADG
jgi:ABC-type Zn uptake system ZnuABC Zn-binding protein ZnuA